jgi:hypothetical protein
MPFSVLRRIHAGDAVALADVMRDGDEAGEYAGGVHDDAYLARLVEWGATPIPSDIPSGGRRTNGFVATFAARARLGAEPRVFLGVRNFASLSTKDLAFKAIGGAHVDERGAVVLWFKEHVDARSEEGASSLAQRALRALLFVLHEANVARVLVILPSDSPRARRLALAGFLRSPDVFHPWAPDGRVAVWMWTRASAPIPTLARRGVKRVREFDACDVDADADRAVPSDPPLRSTKTHTGATHAGATHTKATRAQVSLRIALQGDKRVLRTIFTACAEKVGQSFIASADFVARVVAAGRHHGSFVAVRKSGISMGGACAHVVGVVLLADPRDMFGNDVRTYPDSLAQRGLVIQARDKCVAWFTHPAHRRSGIMAAAAPLALEQARLKGTRRVLANIAPGNAAAASLARSLGFKCVISGLACPKKITRGDLVDVWMRTLAA